MTAVLPADNYAANNTGHLAAHNNTTDVLALITGASPGAVPIAPWSIVLPSGDTTGTTDTANLTTAFAGASNTASVQLVAGIYYVKSVSLSNQQSLRGVGPTTIINGVSAGPTFSWHGTKASPPWGVTPTYFGGTMADFQLNGSSAPSSAIGLDIGDGIDFDLHHVSVLSYNKSGSIGINLNNSYANFWTERSHFQAWVQDCTQCVQMTVSGSAQWSFEFNVLDFVFQCRATDDGAAVNQSGLLINNGAWFSKGSITLRGNMSTSASSMSNSALSIQGSGGSFVSHINNSRLDVMMETDNGRANSPIPINLGGSNFIQNCMGVLAFDDGWANSVGTGSGALKFGGVIEGDSTLTTNNVKPSSW